MDMHVCGEAEYIRQCNFAGIAAACEVESAMKEGWRPAASIALDKLAQYLGSGASRASRLKARLAPILESGDGDAEALSRRLLDLAAQASALDTLLVDFELQLES